MTEFVVPRGLLITDGGDGNRLYLEQQKLSAYFPQFGFSRSKKGNIRARGALRVNSGEVFALKIKLPEGYPHSIPHIFADGWDADCPHVYSAGNLCIMRPDQWRSFYSIAFVVAKTAIWLNKFEVYQRRGYWPGNEQGH
ncbi:hypothetical protein [Streptomyces sp. NPDC026673]|uniref:hypothetical protein n=1 Tax=Streptomyces sp. NPDC026673 TaxID=3155724 RepID=UPI0033E6758C